jgi:predicted acetylornithine/succinylornithine family transaminase/N-acetyl-ornithine/N-acetyl-lysine deacetylase
MNAIIDLENTYTSGVYPKRPVAIVRGRGALVWDAEGREYIDCIAGHGVANIGHGRPEVAAAIAAQAQRLITCPEIFYNDVRARLLERLAHLVPEELAHIFLCNSGAEAVEGALKFARIATGRTGIVAALRGFHGRTMGALSTTWEPHYREPFAPLVPGVSHVRYNDLAAADAAINEGTAAVIIELVQGEGGVHVAREEYIHGLASLCRERGALLIVDEVQTGFGRTGRLFACQHYNLQPDILCLAKSLAGGVPMGAICLGRRVIESGRITRGVHGSSFGGNPLACAAALATLDILEQEALPQRAAVLGEYALERLKALHTPLIREVRGRGLLLGIELRRRVQPYLEALRERGVLALPAGPNVIRLLPPLVISEEQLERALGVVEEVLLEEAPASPAPEDEGFVDLAPEGLVCASMAREGLAPARSATAYPKYDQDREVSLLHNMLTIPSYSRQESALAHYLVEQSQQLGLYSYVDEVGNLIASTHPCKTDRGLQPIILLGHMDTVRGYIPVRLQDGELHGRGAVDAKGPLAALLCAAGRMARVAPTESFQHPIVVIGAVEEESASSRGARAVVERYQPFACIIGEPSGSQAVTIGYKGRLLVEYCLTRPLHHSAGSQQNGNEVAVAFWNRVCQHAAAWNEQYAPNSTFAALMPSLRSMSSDQDGLEEQVRLCIGYRLPPSYDLAGLRTQLEQWADEDEASISFSGEEAAIQTTRSTPLARAFISAIRAAGGQPVFKHKTGTSDMNVVGPAWGQNIVAYGPGDSRLDHTPQEHIHIAEYVQSISILELVLKELALGSDDIVRSLL